MSGHTPEPLPNVADAAALLGVSKATVLRRIRAGEIQATRAGSGRTASWVIPGEEWSRLIREETTRAQARAHALMLRSGS